MSQKFRKILTPRYSVVLPTLIAILYATAMRLRETISIKAKWVDKEQSSISVAEMGNKPHIIYLRNNSGVHGVISDYLKERSDAGFVSIWLFPSHPKDNIKETQKSKPLTGASAWKIVKKAAKAEGFPQVSPRDFRHYRAAMLLKQGMPLESVQVILGHTNISTTRQLYVPKLEKQNVEQLLEQYDIHDDLPPPLVSNL